MTAALVHLAQSYHLYGVPIVVVVLVDAVRVLAVGAAFQHRGTSAHAPLDGVEDEEERVFACAPVLWHHLIQVQHEQVVNEEIGAQHSHHDSARGVVLRTLEAIPPEPTRRLVLQYNLRQRSKPARRKNREPGDDTSCSVGHGENGNHQNKVHDGGNQSSQSCLAEERRNQPSQGDGGHGKDEKDEKDHHAVTLRNVRRLQHDRDEHAHKHKYTSLDDELRHVDGPLAQAHNQHRLADTQLLLVDNLLRLRRDTVQKGERIYKGNDLSRLLEKRTVLVRGAGKGEDVVYPL
ncbi:hypothetical protein AGDE_14470 [Angomonas deanei]|nr:hypothetical protein AGDE_14470 [Angomonas deanei]|eukprot:EPY20804.1 hypothetical protein AGDE_14470 [Angomonas deanei]